MEDVFIISNLPASSLCHAELYSASGRKSLDSTGSKKYFPSPLIATLNLPICLFLFVMGYNCFRRALQSDIVLEVAQIKTHFSHQICFFAVHFPDGKKKNPPCAISHIFTPFLSFSLPVTAGGGALSNSWGERTR